MFNHKKFLAALLCTPLFTACVVSGDDSDDVGNTETDPSNSTTMSTTVGTEDDTSAGTTVSTTVSTDDSGSDTGVDSGSSEGTTGDTAGDGMFCLQACTEPVDCCNPADPTCPDNVGTYPNNLTCDGGVCANLGCTEDADCSISGPDYVCSDIDGYGLCELPCVEDADCEAGLPGFGYVCLDDGNGGTTCQPGPCEADEDCGGAPYVCEADGGCAFVCTSDADCTAGGTCDVATGACGCTDETECVEGFTCAA
jgi:hypothetical protein